MSLKSDNEFMFFTRGQKLPDDIEVVHYPYFEPFSLSLPVFKKSKTVVTVHDLTPLLFPEHFPAGFRGNTKWRIQRQALRRVDAIITDSEISKKDIHSIVRYPKEKIFSIPLAAGKEFKVLKLNKEDRASLKKKYHLPEKFALYVGDVTWNKNLPRLIRAIQKTQMPLVMVGKALASHEFDHTNPWNADLVHVQKEIDTDQFRVLGFVSTQDLVGIYNMAEVFVFPSLYEGFGLPILEAMSCGCPVITSKAGSLPEVAGDAAYYIDPRNEESITEGITAVISNEKIREELSQKGLQQAQKFSWEKTAKETLAVYQSL
jgi:glycosyltransferase involved in cell wall biosynthesis